LPFTGFFIVLAYNRCNIIIKNLIIIGVIVLMCLSLFSLFASPVNNWPNSQISYNEIKGEQWFNIYGNEQYYLEGINKNKWFATGTQGYLKTSSSLVKNLVIPNHFNYANNKFDEQLKNTYTYRIIRMYDKKSYLTVWKQVDRFTSDDFFIDENKKNSNKLYATQDICIYLNKNIYYQLK
jgi:hypothetical protein